MSISKNKEIELSLDEVKSIEFDILVFFDSICTKYNLNYSLAYGTLLGAVRHGGFIPWDDDIDVMMPRPDYERFINIFQKEITDNRYKLASMYIDDDYFSPLTKMYDSTTKVYQSYGQVEGNPTGVYIDIFVVDGLPENNKENFYNKAERIRRKWSFSVRKIFSKERTSNTLRMVIGSFVAIPFKILGFRHYRDKYNNFCSSYSYNDSQKVGVVLYGEGITKENMPKKWFDTMQFIMFEGKQFKSISCEKEYLSQMYGDFMKLPPESQRISKHHSKKVKILK